MSALAKENYDFEAGDWLKRFKMRKMTYYMDTWGSKGTSQFLGVVTDLSSLLMDFDLNLWP